MSNHNPNSFTFDELALTYDVDGDGWKLRRYAVDLTHEYADTQGTRVLRD